MPQDLQFEIPIPTRINPDRAGARDRSLAWARRQGLIRSKEASERYIFSEVSDLAAYAYPDATEEGLDLAFDVNTWFFLFDDQFEVPTGQYPHGAVAACHQLIDLLHQAFEPALTNRRADASPIVAAFTDLWQRMTVGMSPAWRSRTTHDWVNYLAGNITEATDQRAKTTIDTKTHLRRRRKTIGWRPSIAINERVGGFEVPPSAWHSSLLESMRRLATDHIIYVNEIYSLEKEEARNETNLVHTIMQDTACSRQDAIDQIYSAAGICFRRLTGLERQIELFCDRLTLPGPDRIAVLRYVDAMHGWIRGNYDWHTVAGRYKPEAISRISPNQPGFLNLEDLTTAAPLTPPRE